MKTKPDKPFSIIVATDQNNGIGLNNTLPWHLPADLKHFKTLTTQTKDPNAQNAIIMGRKTWDSLPEKFKPLPNRLNIVLTTNKNIELPPNVLKAHSFESIFKSNFLGNHESKLENIFVIGGANIYKQALTHPNCQTLYITKIQESFDCDTTFPPFQNHFTLTHKTPPQTQNDLTYHFETHKNNLIKISQRT